MRGRCLAGIAWYARLALVLCLAAAARVGECAELRCDGTIVRLDGDLAYVELPTWPVEIDEGMVAAFFEVLDVFISTNGTDILVADIDVQNVARVERLEKDFAVLKMRDADTSEAIKAAPGRAVLIREDFKHGRQLAVVYDPRSPTLAFIETFSDTKLGTFWETLPGAGKIDGGKLIVDSHRGQLRKMNDPHPGELTVKLRGIGYESKYKFNDKYLTTSPLGIEFDLESTRGIRVALDQRGKNTSLLPVEYVVGRHEGMQPGIHWQQKSIAKLEGQSPTMSQSRRPKHVFIGVTPTSARLEVDKASCVTALPKNPMEEAFAGIVIFCEGKFSIDNFKLWWLPKAPPSGDYPAAILGYSLKKDRLLISRGGSKAWKEHLVGRKICLQRSSDAPAEMAVVSAEIGDMLVCRIDSALAGSLNSHTLIFIEQTREPPRFGAARTEEPVKSAELPPAHVAMRLIPKKNIAVQDEHLLAIETPPPDALFAALEENGDNGFELRPISGKMAAGHSTWMGRLQAENAGSFELCLAYTGRLSTVGYICPVVETVSHPVSGCVMGARLGQGSPCSFKQNDMYVTVTPGMGQSIPHKDAQAGMFVMSRQRLAPGGFCAELLGRAYSCDFESGSQSFWDEVGGQWRRTQGRFLSSSPKGKEGVAMLMSANQVRGSLQFDFDVIVEKPVTQVACTYTKDISCLFYSPSRKSAVTLGFGAEGYGGVSFDRGTPVGAGGHKFVEFNDLGEGQGWRGHGRYIGGLLEAKLGRNYRIRIRKLGVRFVMYINNRRVAAEEYPEVEGELQAWLIAPESILSIDNVMLQELTKKEHYLKEEPFLGEFGYVLAAGEKEILVDSGVPGLQKGAAVRIVKPTRVTRAQNDARIVLSADFECVANGVVEETGMRLARVRIVETFEPIARGMKVFTGQRPKSFAVSGTELSDIDYVF